MKGIDSQYTKKSNVMKQQRNQLVWSYITSIEALIKLQRCIEERTKNKDKQEFKLDNNLENLEGTSKQGGIASDVPSWPPLNAHEIKQHYPKDVKVSEVWSIINNYKKLDPERHKRMLESIALKATEYLIDHGWNVPSNSAKADLYQQVEKCFFTEEKLQVAEKLLEFAIRQDKKNKQKWTNSLYQSDKKLQKAKHELAEDFEACKARLTRIERKSIQYQDIPWHSQILRRGGGSRYENRHEHEIGHINQELKLEGNLRLKKQDIQNESEDRINKFSESFSNWCEEYKSEQNTVKKKELHYKAAQIILTSFFKELAYINTNLQKCTEESVAQQKMLAQTIEKSLDHASHGIWTEVGLHVFDLSIARAAFITALMTSHGATAAAHGAHHIASAITNQ